MDNSLQAILIDNKDLTKLCQKQGITYLGLFGSQARGEARRDSDVDLMVDFAETKSLFEIARIIIDLEDMVGKKIDLVERDSIKPILKPYIEKNLISVYEKN